MSQIQTIYAPKTEKQLNEVYSQLERHQQKILELSKMSIDFYGGKNANNPAQMKAMSEQIDKLNKKIKEQNDALKKLQTTQAKVVVSKSKIERANQKQLATNEKNYRVNKKLASAWTQLNAKLAKAELRFKNLAVSQGLSNKQTKIAQKEVLILRSKVDAINTSVKRFNGNVGNYKSAFKGLGASLSGLMSAFGMVGGVYLFASAIKDAFTRVREFDKAMQNIAGVMRVSRSEISDLEDEIIKVASSSVKTSREVAKLAENLVTLGKTKEEIKDLLEPVNNLAIGLETTSGEAAEFLVQTLNAFGASSDEAAKYADTIATIRTSTSLDFQKMRDSFQYITPIARLLNKDLADVGSMLGIMADNGQKAEQSGRLLGTGLQKLAKEGRTLKSALTEINDAQARGVKEYELLAIASKIFGTQAGKIGIILANNTNIIDTNAQAIRDNGGALDDLVNQQLESLDAKLKILDSSWERLILSIDNGEGTIGKTFGSFIGWISKTITEMSLLEEAESKVFGVTGKKRSLQDKFTNIVFTAGLYKSEIEKLVDKQREFNLLNNELDGGKLAAYSDAILLLRSNMSKDGVSEDLKKLYSSEIEYLENIVIERSKVKSKEIESLKTKKDLNEETIKTIEFYQKSISANKALINTKKTVNDINEVRRLQKENKEHQKQIDLILGNTKAKKKNKREKAEAITLTIKEKDHVTDLVKAYKLMQKPLQKNSDLYKEIQNILDGLNGVVKAESLLLDESYNKKVKDAEATLEQRDALLELQKAIDDFLESVALGALGELGLGSLTTFFDGTFDDLMDDADGLGEKFAVTFSAISRVAEEAFAIINQASQQSFGNEYGRLEAQYAIATEFAGDSATAKAEIDRQYEQKRADIQRRQAKAEKEMAIFSIINSTARGVISALGTGNIPLSIAVGVIGAAKLAMVSAQEIPEFKDGVQGFSGGLAKVNDAKGSNYKEIIQTPNGKLSMAQGRNAIVDLPSGSNVIKATETDSFLNSLYNELSINDIMPFNRSIGSSVMPSITNNGISKDELREVFSAEVNKLSSTIRNKSESNMIFDENGFNHYVSSGHNKKKSLNARVNGRGNRV